MSVWTMLWLMWALMFAAIETVAIVNDTKDDTLSEHFRNWFRTDKKLGRTFWLFVSGVFAGWFIVHIAVAGSI